MLKSLFLAAVLLAAPVVARQMTPEDLVSLNRLGEPAVSRDGRTAAYILRETDLAANRGRFDLFLLDLTKTGAQPVRVHATPTATEHAPAFSPDGRTLYFLSDRGGSNQIWSAPVAGGAARQITNLPMDIDGFLLSPSGDRAAVWAEGEPSCPTVNCPAKPAPGGSARTYDQLFVRHWDTWAGKTRSRLYTLPLTGTPATDAVLVSGGLVGDVPSKPSGDGAEISWAPDGRTLYFALREAGRTEAWSTNLDIFATAADGSSPPVNLTAGNLATDTNPAVSPDGRLLAWTAMKRPTYEADREVVMLRDLKTGKVRTLTGGWDRSVQSIAWSPNSGSILVKAQSIGQVPAYRVDIATGRINQLTGDGAVTNILPVGNGALVTMESLTAPSDLFRIDEYGAVSRLTSVNADKLAGIELGKPEQFSFAGANGDKVHGWVVKPAGLAADAKAPVALLIHGGPQGSFNNSWSYRWNPQSWAGHGFAVVTVDFHGSTGYGQAFTDSINQDWGGKPLEDLKLGLVTATTKYGWLDGDRACALGGSYGGFMTNWIAGQWPDRFKCLVTHAGIFDARGMAYSTEELWFDEWEHGGTYHDRPEEYERWNPVRFVDKWQTPMLVIHGEKDFRIPYAQGLSAFTALQRRGVASRLVMFPDENHWVLKPANSLQWHREVFGWMDRWLKPVLPRP